jgi:4-hydroxy-tetrahydrodipicolinate synthase
MLRRSKAATYLQPRAEVRLWPPANDAGQNIERQPAAQRESDMDTTRRMFVGMGAATAAMAASAPSALSAPMSNAKDKFWIAATTPCDRNYEFDAGAYAEQLAWWKSQGADGVLVLGTNGEGPSFSVAERKKIAETAIKHRNGLDLIITTGTPNFKETIELSQHAAAIGGDSVLIQPPFYFKNPQADGLLEYFRVVMEKLPASLAVRYYDIPQVTGVTITPAFVTAMAERHPNFVGIKNSHGVANEFEALSTQTPGRLNIISGTDNNMLAALKHGNGVILGSGNVYTKIVAGIFAAHRAGQDPQPAFDKLTKATSLMAANGYSSNYNAIKYALNLMMGADRVNVARPPHIPLTDEEKAKLRAGVAQLRTMA